MNNKIELKNHNKEIYKIVKKAYSEKNHICVVQATGTGKSFLQENNYDFIILDEYHRCGAKTWYKPVKFMLDYYKDVKVLGVTATPVRYLDGNRDMSKELFDSEPISDISLLEAINKNILPSPKYVLSYYKIEDEI
ncbi:MAG: DEAD/DEAH box helicase family protein [Romboutsia sp.]|nr:DEAD/DEAH box helicase family protein [Romboutsia sp.]